MQLSKFVLSVESTASHYASMQIDIKVLTKTDTIPLNINHGVGTNDMGQWSPWTSATTPNPNLWAAHGTAAADGQPSFLDFDGLFDDSFPFLNDLEKV